MVLRVGTIPTNGRDCVDQAVQALLPQVDELVVVEAGHTVTQRLYPDAVTVVQDTGDDLNISRWWNIGFDWAAKKAAERGEPAWDVAVINDDVIVPSNWLCYVADDLRGLGCVAGCSGGRDQVPVIHRQAGPVNLFTRILGFAYVVVGESGLRADEELKWWYGDDFLGSQAASMGGMVMFPACHVEHLYPGGQTTLDHQPQIMADRQRFIEKAGFVPW